jgi:hypothetical protein
MPLDLTQFLNSHKNALLEVAKKSEIPLKYFKTHSSGNLFEIIIDGTPLVFSVEQSKEKFDNMRYGYTRFEPGFPKMDFPASFLNSIDSVCYYLGDWLFKVVKKYLDFTAVPDQWSEILSIQPFIGSTEFATADFEKYSESEKEQIKSALEEFKRMLREELETLNQNIDQVQEGVEATRINMGQINERLDYLGEAVNRLNRFDWKGVALSTVIGIVTNLSVDTSTAKHFFDLFQQAFGMGWKFLLK